MKDDKKKLYVLGALVVVIFAVGAFQLFGSGGNAPTPAAAKTASPTGSAEGEYAADNADNATAEYAADGAEGTDASTSEDPLQQLYAMGLPARDPFLQLAALPGSEQAATTPPPPAPAKPPVRRAPWREIPPFPIPGNFGGNVAIPGSQPNPDLPPPGPAYAVSGVIRGEKNAAVVSDSSGRQRLVKEGQELDGDTRVHSIHKDKVVLKTKDGKTITLNVGGNP